MVRSRTMSTFIYMILLLVILTGVLCSSREAYAAAEHDSITAGGEAVSASEDTDVYFTASESG